MSITPAALISSIVCFGEIGWGWVNARPLLGGCRGTGAVKKCYTATRLFAVVRDVVWERSWECELERCSQRTVIAFETTL